MTNIIVKEDLQHYFDHFSSVIPTQLVEIEVAGLEIGDQIAAEWVALEGITYDSKDDVIVVDLADKFQHIIKNPQQVAVEEDNEGIHSIEIKCGEGHLHLLKLKNAVPLTSTE